MPCTVPKTTSILREWSVSRTFPAFWVELALVLQKGLLVIKMQTRRIEVLINYHELGEAASRPGEEADHILKMATPYL